MNESITLAMKDLRLLVRDKPGFFFVFFFPLLVAIFFGSIFAGDGGGSGGSAIPVAVVREDHGEEAEMFVRQLEEGEEFRVYRIEDRAEAADPVRRGRLSAYIVIEEGFSEASRRMFWGDPMRISLGIDPARRAEAGMIEGLVTAAAYERMQGTFGDRQTMRTSTREAMESLQSADDADVRDRELLARFLTSLDLLLEELPEDDSDGATSVFGGPGGGWNPIEITRLSIAPERARDVPTSSFAISFPQGIVWGIMGSAAGFGISLVTERNRGTLVRLRMAPIAPWQILAGKGLACFLSAIGVSIVLLIIGAAFFGVRPISIPLLIAALISAAFAFSGIMMLLSVIGKTEASAGGIGWALLLLAGMFGGAMVPLFIMPGWMQSISHISPVKWAVLALEGAIWRGFTIGEMFLPCAILIAIGVVGFAIGSRLFNWTEAQ